MEISKAERSRALRYKKGALATMGWQSIMTELEEISEACDEVSYFMGSEEDLIEAFDGNDEEAWEFRFSFSDLSAKCSELYEAMYEFGDQDDFDDCTVALVGNRYEMVGFDSMEEDYYSLCQYESELSVTEAGKRLMRKTKAEMISSIGQAVGTLMAFLDLRERYDYLRATIDILRDENHSVLQQIKQIEELYEKASADRYGWTKESRLFDNMLETLPDRMWVE